MSQVDSTLALGFVFFLPKLCTNLWWVCKLLQPSKCLKQRWQVTRVPHFFEWRDIRLSSRNNLGHFGHLTSFSEATLSKWKKKISFHFPKKSMSVMTLLPVWFRGILVSGKMPLEGGIVSTFLPTFLTNMARLPESGVLLGMFSEHGGSNEFLGAGVTREFSK